MSNIVIIPTYKERENIEALVMAISSLPIHFDILVIDDNSDNGTTITVLLDKMHTISTAKDGKSGIAMAREVVPDLILLDISLPGMDGFEVLGDIRKDDHLRQIPVIAVTARAMKGDREQIMDRGFDGYISKPIDVAVFEETISQWIGKI